MKRRSLLKAFTLTASIAAMGMTWTVQAAETIKVGILHSLSGTMAISETSLKDMALMTIDEINAKGGVNGKMLEAVVVDPASNWPLFAEKGRQLLTQDKVAVVFGCWTSVSRKSVLPVFEELNGLLFYPVQYEGEEMSPNVFYTGAAPNQQAIPAVEYLMSEDGGSAKRFVLLGTDYVYPRTTNKILRAFLHSKGVADKDIDEVYTPFGHSDYQTIVSNIKKFSAGGKTAVISTVNGDSNVPFYKELANQGLKATDVPVIAFSVGEEELRGIDTKPLVGNLAAWNYFESVQNPVNQKFVTDWKAYAKAHNLPGADKAVTNDPMEATYVGIHMWAQAAEKAKSTDVDKVREAMAGQEFAASQFSSKESLCSTFVSQPAVSKYAATFVPTTRATSHSRRPVFALTAPGSGFPFGAWPGLMNTRILCISFFAWCPARLCVEFTVRVVFCPGCSRKA